MGNRNTGVSVTALVFAAAGLFFVSAGAQAQTYTPPKTATGLPDLQGIWQVVNSAADNLESHEARKGGAAGLSVVEGDTIPYKPEALAKRKDLYAKSQAADPLDFNSAADPLDKCLMPGVPRITYLPYPFQIFEFQDQVVMVYEYLHLTRFIFMDGSPAPDQDVIDFYMGYSRGRWDGNTLVVETTNNKDETWFDKAANFHSDALKVTERFTRTGPDQMQYEATMEDPQVFTRPWKIQMPVYRRLEKNARLLEYECYQFREDELSKTEDEALKKAGKSYR
jgi:hypothetical protein